jgi:hypothetical protein
VNQNSSTFGLVIDVGESVECLVDPPELSYSLRQFRWPITDLKRSHDALVALSMQEIE